MRWWFTPRDGGKARPMPVTFNELARYNAEVARGIVHTAEWDERMAKAQREFAEWARSRE